MSPTLPTSSPQKQHKLVTIALWSTDNGVNSGVTEHLEEYLEDDWKVVSMTPVGAGVGHSSAGAGDGERTMNIHGWVGGWLAVLLEK